MKNKILETFEFDGKKYEVRAELVGNTITIRTFLNGFPANGYSYQLTLSDNYDLEKALGIEGICYLINLAKDDIYKKRWERVLKAIRKS